MTEIEANDYVNMFDDPETRSKMTAKQIIEAVKQIIVSDAEKITVASVQHVIDKYIEANGKTWPNQTQLTEMICELDKVELTSHEKFRVGATLAYLLHELIPQGPNNEPAQ